MVWGEFIKAIDEVTTTIQKGQQAIESGANLDDLKNQASDKMKSAQNDAAKKLVDVGAKTTGMEGTVKAARALGMKDKDILKKSAKIANKAAVAAGGGKTRKKRKRKNKTRNKKRRRNKSKKVDVAEN